MQIVNSVFQSFPVLTTILAGMFAAEILQRYINDKSRLHFLWWGIGLIFYATGTLIQSLMGFAGWNEFLYKTWYICSSLMGAAPLAVGTIYFVASRAAGHTGVILVLLTASITTSFVILSPINTAFASADTFNGNALGWQFVRQLPLFLNIAAALVFLYGAVTSMQKLAKDKSHKNRYLGNILIAIGGLLPGSAGFLVTWGHLNALYTVQLLGLMFMWYGYYYCLRPELREVSEVRKAVRSTRPKHATV